MSHRWSEIYDGVQDAHDSVQAYSSCLETPDRTGNGLTPNESPRCHSSCVDPVTIFGPTGAQFGLFDCVLYTNITNAFRAGSLSGANKTYLTTKHVDTSLAHAADVTSTISTCLSEYCESLDDCKNRNTNVCSAPELSINGSMLDADKVGLCVQSICTSHPGLQANTDIAGIGILAAYIFQIGIALLSALVLLGLVCFKKDDDGHISNGMNSDYNALASVTAENPDTSINPRHAQKPREKVSRTKRLYGALLVALVDFLKAQCFLAMAISIAALILLNSKGSLSMLDQMALVTASGVGVLPTTFNLYILATFNPTRKSWFLYVLSLCTWILGFSVALSPQMAALNRRNKLTDLTVSPSFDRKFPNACGNISPVNICPAYHQPNLKPEYTFCYALCLPIMLGLTVWQLSSDSRISAFLNTLPIRRPRDFPWFWSTILHLGAMGFFAAPIYLFFKSISDLFTNNAVNTVWSFGQIIAVTVWIPTLTGLVNSYIDGVDGAHNKQLPAGYITMTTPSASPEEHAAYGSGENLEMLAKSPRTETIS